MDLATKAYAELHQLQVLHVDAEPRNILYDAISGTLMVVDFERAELRGRQPLGLISPNGQDRKRKRGWMTQKQGKDDFTEELQSVVERVSMRFGDDLPSGSRPLVSSKGSSAIHFAKLPRCAALK
jgi:serine/threonine protein kinase